MIKNWKSSVLLIGTAMLGAAALSGTNVMAGTLDVDVAAEITNGAAESNPTPLNFGIIEADPVGDIITIAAKGANGTAGVAATSTTHTGKSSVTGSPTSGVIHIASTLGLTVGVEYPTTAVTLDPFTAGNLTVITVYDIAANSGADNTDPATYYTHTAVATGADIHVGGKLNIPAGAIADTYSGAIPVTVHYY